MAEQQSESTLIIPALGGIYDNVSGLAYPLVRLVTGALLIPHGCQKLFGWFGGDINATAAFFSQIGLEPALPLAYLVGVTELFGGILLAIGLLTRPVAVMVLVQMAVAMFLVHLGNGFFWNEGGFEYPLMWGLLALAIAFRGGGPLSVDRAIGREF